MGAGPRLFCREREHSGCEAAGLCWALGCPCTDGWVGPLSCMGSREHWWASTCAV